MIVLIRIKASAICGSDLHAYEYPLGYEFMNVPVTLGHEYAGIVEAVGSEVTQFKIGDRVMGSLIAIAVGVEIAMKGERIFAIIIR